MKDKDFRNLMANDPYLYKDCCGGAMLGADGSSDPVKKQNIKSIIFNGFMVVGIIAVAIYAYKKAF